MEKEYIPLEAVIAKWTGYVVSWVLFVFCVCYVLHLKGLI
jgi:hypothetical protein